VGWHPDIVEVLEQVLRNPVIEDALALDHLVFLGIERGRIVLEVLDQGTRLRSFVKHLGLAFINAASTAHWDVPCVVEIHEFGVLRMTRFTTHDGAVVKARNGKQNANRAWNPTYLIGPPSTIDPAPQGRVLPLLEAVVLTIRSSYLGAREGSRNEAAVAISAENRNPRS
jgi:hypothetical protein